MDRDELEQHNQIFQAGKLTEWTNRSLTGDGASTSTLIDLNCGNGRKMARLTHLTTAASQCRGTFRSRPEREKSRRSDLRRPF